jgi:hypothetical protein
MCLVFYTKKFYRLGTKYGVKCKLLATRGCYFRKMNHNSDHPLPSRFSLTGCFVAVLSWTIRFESGSRGPYDTKIHIIQIFAPPVGLRAVADGVARCKDGLQPVEVLVRDIFVVVALTLDCDGEHVGVHVKKACVQLVSDRPFE